MHVVNDINWYAKQHYEEKNIGKVKNMPVQGKKDTDILEIKGFFGLIILMRIFYKKTF